MVVETEHMDLMSNSSSSHCYGLHLHLLKLVLVVKALAASFLVVVAAVNLPSLFPLFQEVEEDWQCYHFGCNVVVAV